VFDALNLIAVILVAGKLLFIYRQVSSSPSKRWMMHPHSIYIKIAIIEVIYIFLSIMAILLVPGFRENV